MSRGFHLLPKSVRGNVLVADIFRVLPQTSFEVSTLTHGAEFAVRATYLLDDAREIFFDYVFDGHQLMPKFVRRGMSYVHIIIAQSASQGIAHSSM